MSRSRLARYGVLPLLALALAATAPVAAAPAGSEHREARPAADRGPVPPRAGSPDSAVDRVADFYGTYIDVLQDTGRDGLADALRDHYLTDGLRESLTSWERSHQADGVLRSARVPSAWQVTYEDSGMGRAWTRVRLTWGPPGEQTHTYLTVRSDLSTKLISGIEADTTEQGAPAA
ncbi:hypothetical protein [Streptomyces sp. NPDC018031]|uniref:hypothetical protein n=1 Tax=Streptomyces sp. NPDC018031 TaxID=3365033 RepID=UPI003796B94B